MQSMNGNLQVATKEIKAAVGKKEKAEAEQAEAMRRCEAIAHELAGVKRQLTESEIARAAAVTAATVAQEQVERSRSDYEAALSSEGSARASAEEGRARAMADLRAVESERDGAREEVDALMEAAAAHTKDLAVPLGLPLGGGGSSSSSGGGGGGGGGAPHLSGGGPRAAGKASARRETPATSTSGGAAAMGGAADEDDAPRGRLSLALSYVSSADGPSESARACGRDPDSPPQDLYELAAYTRREREKFEALAESHALRMKELMSQTVPLSPATSASALSAAASPFPTSGSAGRTASRHQQQPSLHERLADVQRHFDEQRQHQQRSGCQAAY